MRKKIITTSAAQTRKFAKELASKIPDNAVIGLIGELGAGKTEFVRGFVKHFKISEKEVSSPSFTIINLYQDKICHVDFYRLHKSTEVFELGLDDYISNSKATLIEWYDKACNSIDASIKIYFKSIDKNKREITYEI